MFRKFHTFFQFENLIKLRSYLFFLLFKIINFFLQHPIGLFVLRLIAAPFSSLSNIEHMFGLILLFLLTILLKRNLLRLCFLPENEI